MPVKEVGVLIKWIPAGTEEFIDLQATSNSGVEATNMPSNPD